MLEKVAVTNTSLLRKLVNYGHKSSITIQGAGKLGQTNITQGQASSADMPPDIK